jgi:hypothetical protein
VLVEVPEPGSFNAGKPSVRMQHMARWFANEQIMFSLTEHGDISVFARDYTKVRVTPSDLCKALELQSTHHYQNGKWNVYSGERLGDVWIVAVEEPIQ